MSPLSAQTPHVDFVRRRIDQPASARNSAGESYPNTTEIRIIIDFPALVAPTLAMPP